MMGTKGRTSGLKSVHSRALGLIGVSLLSLTALILACTDKGSGPTTVDYSVVFVNHDASQCIYVADPKTDSIVGTISHAGDIWQTEISPDGRWLYATVRWDGTHPGGFYKFDLQSKVQVGYLPIGGGFALVEGGRTIVLGGTRIGSNQDSLYFVDAAQFQIKEVRYGFVVDPRSQLDATILVGPAPTSSRTIGHMLGVYDFVSGAYDTIRITDDFDLSEQFLHPDKRHVLAIGFHYPATWLYLVDVTTKQSAPLYWPMLSILVRVVFSASGDTAFVSNPQAPDDVNLTGCAKGELLCFDTRPGQYSLLKKVPTDAPIMGLALSPDGTRLYATRGHTVCGGGDVITFDARTLAVLPDTIHPPRSGSPTDIFISTAIGVR